MPRYPRSLHGIVVDLTADEWNHPFGQAVMHLTYERRENLRGKRLSSVAWSAYEGWSPVGRSVERMIADAVVRIEGPPARADDHAGCQRLLMVAFGYGTFMEALKKWPMTT